MRKDRKRNERRSSESPYGPETEESMILWMDAYDDGYEVGYAEGFEQARKEFMQTQLLIYQTGGNA